MPYPTITADIYIKNTDVVAKKGCLSGFIQNDTRGKFKNGDSTGTSPIESFEKQAGVYIVKTKSGAVYRAIPISEEEWKQKLEEENFRKARASEPYSPNECKSK